MTTIVESEVIKRTELGGGAVVLTVRRSGNPFSLPPFQTFATTPASRYAQHLTDATCEATALHVHDVLSLRLRAKSSPGEQK